MTKKVTRTESPSSGGGSGFLVRGRTGTATSVVRTRLRYLTDHVTLEAIIVDNYRSYGDQISYQKMVVATQ